MWVGRVSDDLVTATQVEICQEIFVRELDQLQQCLGGQTIKLRTGLWSAAVQEMDQTREGT